MFFIVLPGFFCPCFSSSGSASLDSLYRDITLLIYTNRYDSAQSLVLNFLENENLSEQEKFYGHYYFSDILKSSGKPGYAVKYLLKTNIHQNKFTSPALYESLLYGKIAECYFDLKDFENSKKYASLSLQINPDSSLRTGGHAINYIMLGYCSFLQNNFPSAHKYYHKAENEYLKANELCELPLCYMKMAVAYNSSGQNEKAEKYLDKALYISDSCNIKNYKLLSLYTLLAIHKEDGKFADALATLEEINQLVELMGYEKQDRLMDELVVRYETKLARKENENLREINTKNEEILGQQWKALLITVIAILVLSVLIFLLYKINVQRKKTLSEIREKNRQIEKQNADLEKLHLLNQKIFSVISHDFRGPVISLQLLLKTLQSKTLDPNRIADYTSDLSYQLNQTKMVMENLLNWAKTEMDSSARLSPVSVPYTIAEEIAAEQQNEAGKKNITIINTIPGELELPVPPDILKIAFRNLLSNAIKFSHTMGTIRFDFDKQYHFLTVSDEGIGIRAEKASTLFSQNVEPSLGTNKENGFGFGLYITYELLLRYKCKISFEPVPEGGSRFSIHFPLMAKF